MLDVIRTMSCKLIITFTRVVNGPLSRRQRMVISLEPPGSDGDRQNRTADSAAGRAARGGSGREVTRQRFDTPPRPWQLIPTISRWRDGENGLARRRNGHHKMILKPYELMLVLLDYFIYSRLSISLCLLDLFYCERHERVISQMANVRSKNESGAIMN